MLEISAIFVIYVIAFMLKKIGNELKAR
jgi:hypothetical protein